jgi:hypothetical protein
MYDSQLAVQGLDKWLSETTLWLSRSRITYLHSGSKRSCGNVITWER